MTERKETYLWVITLTTRRTFKIKIKNLFRGVTKGITIECKGYR